MVKRPVVSSAIQTLRFAAAFTCIYATIVMRPRLPRAAFADFFDVLPEAAFAGLVLYSAPLLVGVVSIARWLRLVRLFERSEFALATRIFIVSCLPLALVPPMGGVRAIRDEAAFRLLALAAMVLCIDGPMAFPEDR